MVLFCKLAVASISLLLSLLFAEGLVRLIAPHPRYSEFTVPDERVGYLLKPGTRGRATNMFGEFDTAIQINQEGFRDSDHPLLKPPEIFRIAFLGDSFTYAEQVEEPFTFVRLSESLLNDRLAKRNELYRVECMNFGVGGYDTQQEVLCYENIVRKYKPDLVILVMYVHNDLLGNVFYTVENGFGRPYFRLERGELRKIPADRPKMEENFRNVQKRLRVRWYHHIQLYNAQKQLQWEIRQRAKHQAALGKAIPADKLWEQENYRNYRYYSGDGTDPVIVEANTVTRLLLQRLEKSVRADGSQFAVALLPAEENLFPERWPERVKLLPGLEKVSMDFDRPFRQVADSLPDLYRSGKALDLRSPLRLASEQGSVFWPRDNHYNGHGQKTVALAMVHWLENLIPQGHLKGSPLK